jgi:hypothetical protein
LTSENDTAMSDDSAFIDLGFGAAYAAATINRLIT